MASEPSAAPSAPKRNSVWADPKIWLFAAGAFVVGIVVTVVLTRQAMDRLTPELLEAARGRWQQADIQNYRIRYEMNKDEYDVLCRNGIVHEVTVNGNVPASSQWSLYSVEGVFNVLQMDLDNAADPKGPFRSGKPIMRVIFDAEWGYTRMYLRSGGGPRGGSFDVKEFTRLDT
ncbi:MAG: hypothetical protein ACPGXK_05740 [Phycisphaerae bacterium]